MIGKKNNQILVVLLLISNFTHAQPQKVNTSVRSCPVFSMVDINNNILNNENLMNKAIVINFIGYKNLQPFEILEGFAKISNKYNDDVVFIAITGDINDNINNIKSVLPKELNYHLVIMNHEEYKKLVLLFNKFPATPLNFIVNKKGEIIFSKYHFFSDMEFEKYTDYIDKAVENE